MHLSFSRVNRKYPAIIGLSSRGQGLAEYSLVLALVAVACIGSLTVLGGSVGNGMNQISGSIGSAITGSAGGATTPAAGNPKPSGGTPVSNGALPSVTMPTVNGPIAATPATPAMGNTVTTPTTGNTGSGSNEPIASLPTAPAPGNITLPGDILISNPVSTKPPTDIIGVPSVLEK